MSLAQHFKTCMSFCNLNIVHATIANLFLSLLPMPLILSYHSFCAIRPIQSSALFVAVAKSHIPGLKVRKHICFWYSFRDLPAVCSHERKNLKFPSFRIPVGIYISISGDSKIFWKLPVRVLSSGSWQYQNLSETCWCVSCTRRLFSYHQMS